MQSQENVYAENENVSQGFSMRDYFDTCFHYWYWFLISVVLCTGLSILFAKSQMQTYRSYAYVLIKSDEKSGNISDNALFSDLGIGNPSNAVENEIYVIKSSGLMDQVVRRLDLNVTYYIKPLLRKVNIYKKSPVKVEFFNEIPKLGYAMEVKPVSDTSFEYRFPNDDDSDWRNGVFDKKETFADKSFIVNKTAFFNEDSIKEIIYVSISDIHEMAISIVDNLEVKKPDKETNILGLRLDGNNYEMCKDILDNLIDAYNQDVISDKNRVAKSTEIFIVDRIAALAKDLGGIDGQIERLKIDNNIPDITAASGLYVQSGEKYNDNIAEITTQLSLVKYIKEYIANPKNKNGLIPANTGIADLRFNTQISNTCICRNQTVFIFRIRNIFLYVFYK